MGMQVQILSWLNTFLDLLKGKSVVGLNNIRVTILPESIIPGGQTRSEKAPRMFLLRGNIKGRPHLMIIAPCCDGEYKQASSEVRRIHCGAISFYVMDLATDV